MGTMDGNCRFYDIIGMFINLKWYSKDLFWWWNVEIPNRQGEKSKKHSTIFLHLEMSVCEHGNY